MALLVVLALSKHGHCPGVLVGVPVTHWATVPSLPAKPGEHPLHGIVGKIAPGREVVLTAAGRASRPREVNPEHFRTSARLPRNSHSRDYDPGICPWTGGDCPSAS